MMGPIRSLDAIIHTVPSRVDTSDAQKLVIIDCKTKKSVPSKPWFRDVKYYLVTNTDDGESPAEYDVPTFEKTNDETDQTVTLKVKCWITCTPKNEDKVAEALYDIEHPPSRVFARLLKKWVDAFAATECTDFVGEFLEKRSQLQSFIRKQAFDEAGLTLKVKIFLEGEDTCFSPVKIQTGSFLLRVSDYHEQQDLDITCRLDVDEQRKILTHVHRQRVYKLKEFVIDEAHRYFESQISLEKFYDDLNVETILQPLKQALNARLATYGRVVGFIHLETTSSNSAPKQFKDGEKGELQVKVKIHEYPESVVVANTVLMIRENVALYKSKGSPDLHQWLQKQLQEIIPDLFFYKKYINLLVEFMNAAEDDSDAPSLRKEIRHRLEAEANKIGYGIKYIASSPNLQPLTWFEPFPIDVEGTFETRESKFYVKLNLHVSARLTTLEEDKVKGHLNRLEHIPTLMEKKIRDVTRDYIHTVDPERFYTTFTIADPEKYPDNKSIEVELTDRITEALRSDDFRAEVVSFVPKIMDTDVIIRWRELAERVCDFSFEVTPHRGGAAILFTGKFQVEAIAQGSWYKFQSRKFAIEEVRNHLEDVVRAKLKNYTEGELLFKGWGHSSVIQKEITLTARAGVQELFGLDISISMIDRALTEIENAMNQEIIARSLSAIQIAEQKRLAGADADLHSARQKAVEVKTLIDERLRLGSDAPEDQIAEMENRIKSEREKLTPDLITPLSDVESILRPELLGEVRLIENGRFKALPETTANNHEEQDG
jgi:hypothetical protein